jgi:hypothetical protein
MVPTLQTSARGEWKTTTVGDSGWDPGGVTFWMVTCRSQAITTVYAAIRALLIHAGALELDALAKFAERDNAKIVVPFESAGLLGASQTLRSVLAAAPLETATGPRQVNPVLARVW